MVSAPVAGVDEDDDAEEMQEEDRAFFVLAFDTRRKTTTLHRCKGCYRGRRLLFEQYQLVFEEKPAPGGFTTTCRSCWPTQDTAANGLVILRGLVRRAHRRVQLREVGHHGGVSLARQEADQFGALEL